MAVIRRDCLLSLGTVGPRRPSIHPSIPPSIHPYNRSPRNTSILLPSAMCAPLLQNDAGRSSELSIVGPRGDWVGDRAGGRHRTWRRRHRTRVYCSVAAGKASTIIIIIPPSWRGNRLVAPVFLDASEKANPPPPLPR